MQDERPGLAREASIQGSHRRNCNEPRPTNVGRKIHPCGPVESTVVKDTDRYSRLMVIKTNNSWQKYDRKKTILKPARIKHLEKIDQDFSADGNEDQQRLAEYDRQKTILELARIKIHEKIVLDFLAKLYKTNKGWQNNDGKMTILGLVESTAVKGTVWNSRLIAIKTNKGWRYMMMRCWSLVESTDVKGTVWNSRLMAIKTNKCWQINDGNNHPGACMDQESSKV